MPPPTVRFSVKGHRLLSELAEEWQATRPAVLDQALETHRGALFLRAANADLVRLKADCSAWRAYREELAAVKATLADGFPL